MQSIQLAKFEGPLELLLELIEERKLDITEIALSEVTEQYLKHLELIKEKEDLAHITEFLEVAARLLLIKSRMILPGTEEENEEEIEDLKAKLLEYKRYKEAAKSFEELLASPYRSFRPSSAPKLEVSEFLPPDNLAAETLVEAFRKVLAEIPEAQSIEEEGVQLEKISVEQKIAEPKATLKGKRRVGFMTLMRKAKTKYEAIVSFLAVLELIKAKFVTVSQAKIFEDITIEAVGTLDD